MKRITYIISIAAAAFFCSCEKLNTGLTELPIDDINPDAYFTSESECQLWLNRCYYNYIQTPVNEGPRWTDVSINTTTFNVVEGNRLVTDSNTGEMAWGWETMRRINLFLEHSSNCKDEAVRLKYEGVARFFRALGYFEKVKRFGDVPWYDHVVSSTDMEDLRRPRDSRGYVMLQVLKDLDFAIEHLGDGASVAQVSKWSALALKSRAALYEGTWRIYHKGDVFEPKNDPTEFDGQSVSLDSNYFLNIAVSACEEIMNSGKYTVYNKGNEPYRSLFCTPDACTEEVILAKLYSNSSSELKNFGHNYPYLFTNASYGFTKRFVNMYLCKDGSRFTDRNGNFAKMWILDEIVDRDPRLSQTIMCPGYKKVGEDTYTINDFSSTLTGYKPIKWAYTAAYEIQSKNIVDLAIFRYGEVLLNYAEAKAELGNLTQGDLDKSVNLLRKRVGMPALIADVTVDPYMEACYPNSSKTNGNKALVLEVRRERIIEMALEGLHFWDLLRWCEGAQIFDNTFPKFGGEDNTGYYGVYFPGFPEGQDYILYDMDGDGVNDFEIYRTKASGKVKNARSLSSILDSKPLVDPDDPTDPNPSKGYMTAKHNVNYNRFWKEDRDYLWPIPQRQINLTEGALEQNPNWN